MDFRPFFLDGPAGPLFAVHYPPKAGVSTRGSLVYVPPFAEEMNQSRRMASLQARRFAEIGVGTLLLDLYGTGDSAGEFAEARWDTWLGDVSAALTWLEAEDGGPVGLWSLRLGAILALEVARDWPRPVSRVILWQPVVRGARMLEQFLRVRVAAALGRDGTGETTKSLRQDMARGETIEVAGYQLAPACAAALEAADLASLAPPPGCRVDWFEIVAETGQDPTPASRKVAEAWRAGGTDIALHAIAGQQFWAAQVWDVQEGVLVPELWEETTALCMPKG